MFNQNFQFFMLYKPNCLADPPASNAFRGVFCMLTQASAVDVYDIDPEVTMTLN